MVLILAGLILGLLYLMLISWSRYAWGKAPSGAAKGEPVFISVIIPARNEEANIGSCLESVLQQDHPRDHYEVIIVDDHSTDRTAEIVGRYNDERIRLIRLEEVLKDKATGAFKKQAIAAGVERARGELILTTDADCRAGNQWLSSLSNFFTSHHPDMITMPVKINGPSTGLAIFETLDFLSLQGMTGALVTRGKISMANGANLCYTKEAFLRVNGFEGIDHIASGDDMLLMEKIRMKGGKISYLKDRNVIVETNPVKSLRSFFSQRIRWASKTAGYKDWKIQWVLGLVYFFNLCLLLISWRALTGCECRLDMWGGISVTELWIMLLSAKTIVELFFLWPVSGFFGQRKLLLFFLIAQIPHILYVVISGFLGLFGSYEWKGRRVK
jgi:cellulose synthase/poly-beta-1,6-N-acetylglucosamine synthase-like glycosyltransferase